MILANPKNLWLRSGRGYVMASVIDIASAIMSRSERLIEIASQNVSNINTAAYKRKVSFDRILSSANSSVMLGSMDTISIDLTPGKLINTGRAYDLAISGSGFFVLAAGQRLSYTRQGQFDRDGDGRLVNGQGLSLQVEGGGDLHVKSDNFQVLEDGSVVEGGSPVGKLAIAAVDPSKATPIEGGAFVAADSAVSSIDKPSIHQGKLEASNVSMGAEMVTIMGALRRAQTGQRLAMVYDDLMGRVLQTFGQSI